MTKLEIPVKIEKIQKLSDVEAPFLKETGNEENIKIHIVKPLLESLGYTKPSQVDYEYKIDLRRADIVLLIKNKPKVLIEVKSSNQDLDKHVKQALDYSLSIGCPYTLLTNGNEFRLYITFIPNVISPHNKLIFKFQREELLDKWVELYNLISFQNLSSGHFEQIAEKKKFEISEFIVPKELSDHLKKARDNLVQSLKKTIEKKINENRTFRKKFDEWVISDNQNKVKLEEQVNRLARMTAYNFITKIYFCRILEDKNKITKRLSRNYLEQHSWDVIDTIRLSYSEVQEIDYQAIFKHRFFDSIYPDDKEILVKIILELEEYDFSKVNHDILGKIYEYHIDKEERRELGQYYTPPWIIKYILDQLPITTKSMILDPACGSGGFLIQAYDRLYKLYLSEGIKPDDAHKSILEFNIFGFDVNPFAVILSATNLALRNINVSTDKINIFELDSLVINLDNHLSGIKKHSAVKSTEFGKGNILKDLPNKFDIIVGNPPYFILKKEIFNKKYKPTFKYYDSISKGQINIVSLFLVRYIKALRRGGYLSFIVPKVLTFLESWRGIRRFIIENTNIIKIFDIREAFEDVRLEMVVLVLKKKGDKEEIVNNYVSVDYLKSRSTRNYNNEEIFNILVERSMFTEDIFPLYRGDLNLSIYNKMHSNSILVEEICDVNRGPPVNKKIYKEKWLQEKETETCIPILLGRDVGQYTFSQQYWIDKSYPIFDSIRSQFKIRKQRKILAQRIIAQTQDHIKILANYDPGYYLPANTLIYLTVKDNNFDILYLLGLFNSLLGSYYIYNFIFNRATRSMDFSYVKKFPVKRVEKETQNYIASRVSEIIDSYKKIKELRMKYKDKSDLETEKIDSKLKIKELKQKISGLKKEIDTKLFEIHNLTTEEIKLILNQKKN